MGTYLKTFPVLAVSLLYMQVLVSNWTRHFLIPQAEFYLLLNMNCLTALCSSQLVNYYRQPVICRQINRSVMLTFLIHIRIARNFKDRRPSCVNQSTKVSNMYRRTVQTQIYYIIRLYTAYQLHVSTILWPPPGYT